MTPETGQRLRCKPFQPAPYCAVGAPRVRYPCRHRAAPMPFQVTVSRSLHYVRYDAAGPTSLKNFTELATFVAADTSFYEGRLSPNEQSMLGEVAAFKLPYVFRLASLVPVTELTHNSERSAVQKGLTMRAFDSESEALGWLLEREPG